MTVSFYVKTVPLRPHAGRMEWALGVHTLGDVGFPLVMCDNDDATLDPFVVMSARAFVQIYIDTTAEPAIASSAAIAAACCSQVLESNRRLAKKKTDVLAQANEVNGAGLVAGITPAYTPP